MFPATRKLQEKQNILGCDLSSQCSPYKTDLQVHNKQTLTQPNQAFPLTAKKKSLICDVSVYKVYFVD